MVIVIDNYDSFTYNLVQYISELGEKVLVFRNDKISINEIKKLNPDRILISPGPKTPESAGISNEVILNFYKSVPILGVCLGHQCIGYVYGAKIIRAKKLMHGKVSTIYHSRKGFFRNLPNPFEGGRYNSLIVDKDSMPECLEVTAWTKENEIMGLRHKKYSMLEGVQFHPDSILTKFGKEITRNFLKLEVIS